MDINLEQIRALADLAIEKSLAELVVEDGDRSVTIKLPGYNIQPLIHTAHAAAGHAHHPGSVVYAPPAPVPLAEIPAQSSREAEKSSPADDQSLHTITAPMVGTFYAAPSPDSPAYVQVGQTIAKGQVVCIIEAMKMMNELESDVAGKVVRILVENGQPVEFGQPIMQLAPV
jgi:acetyl-CoA carboxylase biotin carboxyl carrier protein